MLKLALLTILIFVVLRLVAGWIGPGLIQWYAGPRAQFGIQDTKFLFGLGAIIFGLVSVFVVENLPTALARRGGLPQDVHSSLTSGLVIISFILAGIILIVSAILGY